MKSLHLTTVNLAQIINLYLIDPAVVGNFISFRDNPSLKSVVVGNVAVTTCSAENPQECAPGMPATQAEGFANCSIDPVMVPLSAWNVTLRVPPFLLNGTLCNVTTADF